MNQPLRQASAAYAARLAGVLSFGAQWLFEPSLRQAGVVSFPLPGATDFTNLCALQAVGRAA
jgi:hypothetical protein